MLSVQQINKFLKLYANLWRMSKGEYLYVEKRVLDAIHKFKQITLNSLESGGLLAGS